MQNDNILSALQAIPPASLTYNDWCAVGMALKEEGYSAEVWEHWSQADRRYHSGECRKKWETFRGSGAPVKGGTIIKLAQGFGWRPPQSDPSPGYVLDWDSEIGEADDLVVVDQNWLEGKELPPPVGTPVQQISAYLETLFDSSDLVGYVTNVWEREGKYLPQKGSWDRTAGQLLEELSICDGDLGSVFGDWNPEAGAWIRFNPLDGQGIRNDNVTDFRYALVESDDMDIQEQYATILAMELPVACLVSSGGKSLHAIVRVDAPNYAEYQKRVDYLYNVCQKNGMTIDRQNRNPSRLSRMPGITRNGREQSLLATNIGKGRWEEWKEWIEAVNDDLPDTEDLSSLWNNLPELSPPLIHGVLRQGHKMLLAGPSKAGKSFSLIELAISLAEGVPWLGFPCAQGRVLYVNLELDRASCLHRFRDVYTAMGLRPEHLGNIHIWNLRGRSAPMDKLAPKMIRRAAKQNYMAIIIDPIYKVITGDENSADQMAAFCNQFDKVCTELGCAVIYCHHHSKGAQGGKRSMDRASGSGVFARDPDALLDMIQLPITEALLTQRKNKATAKVCQQVLEENGLEDLASQDDLESKNAMLELCRKHLTTRDMNALLTRINAAELAAEHCTAWRLEGTLREFPGFAPINVWFDYPIHRSDPTGALADLNPEAEMAPWQKATSRRKSKAKSKKKTMKDSFDLAWESLSDEDSAPSVADIIEYFTERDDEGNDKAPSKKTVYRWIKDYGYSINKNTGEICKNDESHDL